MTTIIYKDGCMAADSRISVGDDRIVAGASCEKLYLVGSGAGVLGISGSANDSYITPEFLEGISDYPSLVEAFDEAECAGLQALAVFAEAPDIVCRVEAGEDGKERLSFVVNCVPGKGIGIGSGGKYAEVACAAGCSAEEAVGLAAEFDPYTGGEIMVIELHDD